MADNPLDQLRENYLTAENLDRKTEEYLQAIAPYNHRELPFNLEQAALVIIDMQRCFLEPAYPLYSDNGRVILPRLTALIEHFRKHLRPVIYAVQQNKGEFIDRGEVLRFWWPHLPLEGSRETGLAAELAPGPEEKIIPKRRYSAFFATDLELTLRSLGIRQVVVAGLFTNVCVEGTVRDAFMRDFFVFLPADTCAALNESLHLGSLRTIALWFAKVTSVSRLTGIAR